MRIAQLLKNGLGKFNFYLASAAGVFLLFATFTTTADVVGREFRRPIPAAFDLCSLAVALMIFFSWAHTQAKKGHVSIDLVFTRLPVRVQAVLDLISPVIGLFIAGVIAWQAIVFGSESLASGEFVDIIRIPLFPFKFMMFLGGLTLSCQFILDIVDACQKVMRAWK